VIKNRRKHVALRAHAQTPKAKTGSWWIRTAKPQVVKKIGDADDDPSIRGTMPYLEAKAKVEAQADRWQVANGSKLRTVADTITYYTSTIKETASPSWIKTIAVCEKNYLKEFGAAPLATLTVDRIRDWLRTLFHLGPDNRRSYYILVRAALKRSRVVPHAMLTEAFQLPGPRQIVIRRKKTPTPEQVMAIVREAKIEGSDIWRLVILAAFTGVRLIQLARCLRTDLENDILWIRPSLKGAADAVARKLPVPMPLTDSLVAMLKAAPEDHDNGLLLSYPFKVRGPGGAWVEGGRRQWTADQWSRPMQNILKRAGTPKGVSLSGLRPARIQLWGRTEGISILEVSKMLDTSTDIIQSSYSRDMAHSKETLARFKATMGFGLLW
jgi:integrase